jgi:hypothetical protein
MIFSSAGINAAPDSSTTYKNMGILWLLEKKPKKENVQKETLKS